MALFLGISIWVWGRSSCHPWWEAEFPKPCEAKSGSCSQAATTTTTWWKSTAFSSQRWGDGPAALAGMLSEIRCVAFWFPRILFIIPLPNIRIELFYFRRRVIPSVGTKERRHKFSPLIDFTSEAKRCPLPTGYLILFDHNYIFSQISCAVQCVETFVCFHPFLYITEMDSLYVGPTFQFLQLKAHGSFMFPFSSFI